MAIYFYRYLWFLKRPSFLFRKDGTGSTPDYDQDAKLQINYHFHITFYLLLALCQANKGGLCGQFGHLRVGN